MTLVFAAGLLVSGCAGDLGAGGGFRALDQQQAEQCDGVPPPAALALLDETATVIAAVVCVTGEQYFPGEGSWEVTTVREVPADRIRALSAGLRLPDLPQQGNACDASLGVLPSFVVSLADGSRIRPAVAGDGCHARRDALVAIDDVATMPVVGTTRITRVRTDVDVVAGCGQGGKSPAVWLESGVGSATALDLPTTGTVSVCRYRPTADQEGELVAAGTVPAMDFIHSWPTLTSTAPAGCEKLADPMQTPATDWALLLQTPNPPYHLDQPAETPIALVDLSGCHRVVDPHGDMAGFMTGSAATELAALADLSAR